MISRIRKSLLPALVAACSLVAVAQASASTVVVSPGGATTATATTATKLVITTTSGSATVNCTSSRSTQTLAGGTGSFSPGIQISGNVTLAFTGCTITGGVPVTVTCTATARLLVTGATSSGGVTPGTISAISCNIVLNSTCGTNVAGTASGSFANSTSQLTVNTGTAQNLRSVPLAGSTCTTLPAGSGQFTNASGAAVIYNVTPAQTVNAA
jgi:hypothetical protein